MDTVLSPDEQAPAGTLASPSEASSEARSTHEGGPEEPAGARTGTPEDGTDEGAAAAAGRTIPDELDELVREGAACKQSAPTRARKASARTGPFRILDDKLVQQVSSDENG